MRLDLRKIAFLLLLAPSAAYAQLWLGPGAVEVRVEDQKGLPVAGAQVVVQYKAVDPKDGPPAVLTDARGKANVSGLAEGPWHLEVSHDGFMTYLAEVTVREKGRPVLEEAAQFNVTGATRTMRVQISRGRSMPMARTPVVAEPAPIPAPTPVPSPPAPAPPKQAPATPPATQTPAPAPRPVSPAPVPEVKNPEPQPVPAPPAPTVPPAVQPKTPPTSQPPQEKPAAPPAPAPRPVAPAPLPTPPPAAPAPAVEPAPRPAPAPPTPPDPVRLRTSKDRTCFECPPGESALSTEWAVPPGGGSGCGADIAAQLANGEVPAGLPAGCHVLRIALPAGMRYTGYRFEMQTGGDSLDCLAGQSCPQSTGRWPINPVLIRRAEGTVVLAPFEAGPAELERRAVFTAYFTAGTAKRPR